MVQTSVPMTEDRPSDAQTYYGDALARWCVYALGAFAIVNQGLDISVLSGLGNLWGSIAIACLASIALVRVAYGLRRQGFRWSRYAGWYILYCGTLILYGLKHPVLAFDGFSVDVEYIVVALLLPWVVESRDVLRLLYGVIAASMLLGVDGLFQYAIKVPIPGNWLDVGEVVRTRVFSVMKSPAEYGANLEMTIPMMFGLLAVDRHPVRRIVYVAAVFVHWPLYFSRTIAAHGSVWVQPSLLWRLFMSDACCRSWWYWGSSPFSFRPSTRV
ncbi:hypothetical protein GCM10025858_10740 [Alicyclobacillus sacchari]|uniref:hypothetical protein n=1 Tax=Alicyclobacillus sacchari TaxID=392010 RepID=UPI0023E9A81E|nr:hypothetical protein [Alicyclobacillus sacchari]GMA56571.1 hypothetical protein GCM10025858_10740 [Alicyclobacillus sacchari]